MQKALSVYVRGSARFLGRNAHYTYEKRDIEASAIAKSPRRAGEIEALISRKDKSV